MLHPYAEFIDSLEKPSRYLGGEKFSTAKEEASVRFALAFPDVYEIGMSHLGFKILYEILNADKDIAAERVFAPWSDLETELRNRKTPLVSLETYRALSQFDLVGFSLQYEMTYTNLLNILDLGGVPLLSVDRGEGDPLVLAGGPCATSPEPLADFVDLFVIGDGEEVTTELAKFWVEKGKERESRAERLLELSTWKGVYVPALYETEMDERTSLQVVSGPKNLKSYFPIQRRVLNDINRFPFPTRSPVSFSEAIFDRFSIELARGCTEGCRFCQAGMIYRPVRERDPKQVVQTILEGLDAGGYDEASLTALSTADYSCVTPLIKELMKELRERKVKLGVSSLRAYGLSEETLDEMATGKASGLTFAPEAGTARMREVIAKNISEEDMLETARRVFSRGWQKVKLYFMIGLPTETLEDVEGIAETALRVAQVGHDILGKGRTDVTISVSSHVPKPHTPFQWAGMDTLEEIQEKQNLLKDMGRKFRLKFRKHSSRISLIEGLISRGDRRIGKAILEAFRRGCRFDGWDESLRFNTWMEVFKDLEINSRTYLDTLPTDGRLPWQHIDVGVTQKFLATEYKRALQGRLSPPCGKPFGAQVHHTNLEEHQADDRKLVCYDCGISCDLSEMKRERAGFLEELGALKKEERSKEAYLDPKELDGPLLPEEGPKFRFRLVYSKLPPVSYVSHLDLLRMIPRHFRRIDTRLVLSGGFKPRPLLSAGPALALGTWSTHEMVDLYLKEEFNEKELLEALNEKTDPGFNYRRCIRISEDEPSLTQINLIATYVLSLDENTALELLQAWRKESFKTVERRRKGKTSTKDVLDFLLDIEEVDRGVLPEELSSSFAGHLIQLRIKLGPQGTLRPRDLLEAALKEFPKKSLRIARTGLCPENGEELPGFSKERRVGPLPQSLPVCGTTNSP